MQPFYSFSFVPAIAGSEQWPVAIEQECLEVSLNTGVRELGMHRFKQSEKAPIETVGRYGLLLLNIDRYLFRSKDQQLQRAPKAVSEATHRVGVVNATYIK